MKYSYVPSSQAFNHSGFVNMTVNLLYTCTYVCSDKIRETNKKIHEGLHFNFSQILTEGFISFQDLVKLVHIKGYFDKPTPKTKGI